MTANVLEATGGRLIRGNDRLCFSGVSIDSRTVGQGELFIALRGDRFDGHDYAAEALEKGALGMVVRKGYKPPETGRLHDPLNETDLIEVSDTLRALQDLAHYHRMRTDAPVVAVTGTNGKTTTKEMIHGILRIGLRAFCSSGNLNNHIGVPLSLLQMDPATEAAVLEFGMSGAGEIRRLREIARPTVVVITNVSEAHMVSLKTLDEVARAKGEILEGLSKQGWAVLNRDDPRVYALRTTTQGKVVTFGLTGEADVTATGIEALGERGSRFYLNYKGKQKRVRLRQPGLHQVSNALAAASAALVLKRPLDEIAEGLGCCDQPAMRWETVTLSGGAVVINDAYNANPGSVIAAIRTMEDLGAQRRSIIVLGDMLELGDESESMHRKVGREIAASTIPFLITVGEKAWWIADECLRSQKNPDRVVHCRGWEQAVDHLEKMLDENDRILVKASRGAGLERIVEAISRTR
jgi:UDP-N-acetylmuramoyl-tripeptide--D-alanyl-D-alanine ligase